MGTSVKIPADRTPLGWGWW